jgi:hypothetical protein
VPGDRKSTTHEILDLEAETEIDHVLSGDARKGVSALGEVFGPRHDYCDTEASALGPPAVAPIVEIAIQRQRVGEFDGWVVPTK